MPSQVVEGWQLTDAAGYIGPEASAVGDPNAEQVDVGIHGLGDTSIGFRSNQDLGRHVLFIGGIGAGKTEGMKALVTSIRAVVKPDDVMVFFDTKGDFHSWFYREGDATICVGDQEAFAGSRIWNLFAELREIPDSELVDEVNELSATLFESVGDSAGDNNRFWTNMAQDLFSGIVIALARAERSSGKRYSNRDIRAVADKWTIQQIRDLLGMHPDLKGTLQYIARDESNTTNSVMIFLQQMLRQTFSSTFRDIGDFSVREFVRAKGGHALFLEFDVARGATLTPVFRALIDAALKESLGRQRAAGRVWVILDEFALLPKLRHIDAGLNFGRSLGMRFIVGTQNTGQIIDAYGEGLGNSVLSAFGTVFGFRLFDQGSREYLKGRFGTNRKVLLEETAVRSRGLIEQLVDGNVIEDWDISGLAVGQCIAALPGRAPLRFAIRRV